MKSGPANERLTPPCGDGLIFARVPLLQSKNAHLAAGPIYLPRGRITYGAVHIYHKHSAEMSKRGFEGLEQVPHFVASILRPGAPLHFEGGGHDTRLAVVQAVSGTVIIQQEERNDELYYNVITAFLGFKRHGKRVGSLARA